MSGECDKWFADRVAKAERQSIQSVSRVSLSRGALGVLVKYSDAADEQCAFNIAASLLPEGVKLALRGGADWTYLPPTAADPCGYIGWQLPPQPLKDGEFLARAWSKTDADLKVEDVVVTRESLAELRASGKYWRVDAPEAMETAASQH